MLEFKKVTKTPKLTTPLVALSLIVFSNPTSVAQVGREDSVTTSQTDTLNLKGTSLSIEKLAENILQKIKIAKKISKLFEEIDQATTNIVNSTASLANSPQELKTRSGIYHNLEEQLNSLNAKFEKLSKEFDVDNIGLPTHSADEFAGLFSEPSERSNAANKSLKSFIDETEVGLALVERGDAAIKQTAKTLIEMRKVVEQKKRLSVRLISKGALGELGYPLLIRAWEDLEFVLTPRVNDLLEKTSVQYKANKKLRQNLATQHANLILLRELVEAHKHSTAGPTQPVSIAPSTPRSTTSNGIALRLETFPAGTDHHQAPLSRPSTAANAESLISPTDSGPSVSMASRHGATTLLNRNQKDSWIVDAIESDLKRFRHRYPNPGTTQPGNGLTPSGRLPSIPKLPSVGSKDRDLTTGLAELEQPEESSKKSIQDEQQKAERTKESVPTTEVREQPIRQTPNEGEIENQSNDTLAGCYAEYRALVEKYPDLKSTELNFKNRTEFEKWCETRPALKNILP